MYSYLYKDKFLDPRRTMLILKYFILFRYNNTFNEGVVALREYYYKAYSANIYTWRKALR